MIITCFLFVLRLHCNRRFMLFVQTTILLLLLVITENRFYSDYRNNFSFSILVNGGVFTCSFDNFVIVYKRRRR